ncbi:MAG: hypothetical protein LBI68_08735 [Azoarcus sp.]|jgi:hypothetical protein|nr:hypothetical protein [Azoarcus sp.]
MKNVLLFCLLSGLGASAVAGASANDHAVEIERPARILTEADVNFGAAVRDRNQNSGNILRCWQQGRLVYEGSGFTRSADGASAAFVVERQGREAVTVLNLQDGLCILSDH